MSEIKKRLFFVFRCRKKAVGVVYIYHHKAFLPSVGQFIQFIRLRSEAPSAELSKSLIWYITPMQQRSKSGFIRDWFSATAFPKGRL